MRAMILAAGRGERMLPLTGKLPKPLLRVGGKPLLQWHIEKLVAAGFEELVINVSHLGNLIEEYFGEGDAWGCEIRYSRERTPLETAGGIVRALPLLGAAPFVAVNGDIWTDYDFQGLRRVPVGGLAHLVLVDNPPQHQRGDFSLGANGLVSRPARGGTDTLTYAGVAVYHPELFAGVRPGKLPLLPVFEAHIARGLITGQHFRGRWEDVGTPERLAALDVRLTMP